MSCTRTPGITSRPDGQLFIDKRHSGVRIGLRLGRMSQEDAERRLLVEMERVEADAVTRALGRPTFADCAGRYLVQVEQRRTIANLRLHVRLLLPYIGQLEPRQVHDATLAPFIDDRLAQGAGPTTVNRSLEVVRTILNRAARSYRDGEGRPRLDAVPPLLTMQPESPRKPYPITWAEQDRFFPLLPAHLGSLVLFAVNTGLRDNNACGLEWMWEVWVPEIGRSVFVVPSESYKSKRDHVVVLNDIAWSIVQAQRGLHPIWVFPYRGSRVATMNNTGWQSARRRAELQAMRVHDLRHTFGSRLRAAGVTAEDRAALLGHADRSMAGHYASADLARLLRQANLVTRREGSQTILRVANG